MLLSCLFIISCGPRISSVKKSKKNRGSVKNTLPSSKPSKKDSNYIPEERFINLNYNGDPNDPPKSCEINNEVNLTVTTVCQCSFNVCVVGVTGDLNYEGLGSFDYRILTEGKQTTPDVKVELEVGSEESERPTSLDIASALPLNDGAENIITLSYSGSGDEIPQNCSITNLNQLIVTSPCSCGTGICQVGVTAPGNYSGPASFDYSIQTDQGTITNTATATLEVQHIDDPPVVVTTTPSAVNEDSESIITLNYTDNENNPATSCSLANLQNVSITTACSCNNGVCTVGVTGAENFNGVGTFDYTVNANGEDSDVGTVSLSINSVDDAPIPNPPATNPTFAEESETILTLAYNDPEGDLATSCNIDNLVQVFVSTPCTCNGSGVCTVGVTGQLNFAGTGGFDYTITAGGETSTPSTVNLEITNTPDPPVANDFTPPNLNEDSQSIITLDYTDPDGDLGLSCSTSNLSQVIVTQACACNGSGVCTVGITGISNYNGVGGFDYQVNTNGTNSNTGSATLNISSVDDPPTSNPIVPPAVAEDQETIVTLSYSDPENDPATSCAIGNESNLSVTTACTCDNGVCNVGVTGDANYNGNASFNYTVTANGETSPAASASITVTSVDDPPVSNNITPSNMTQNTESIITLSYSDPEIDLATACSLTNLNNLSETTPCSCNGSGVCTVGVTGNLGYSGSASFDYSVTANGITSNTATSTLVIEAATNDFISIWETTSNNENIELPLRAGYSYNFTVDWGDGSPLDTVTSWSDPDKVHTYLNPGEYTISINGQFSTIYTHNHPDRNKLIEVVNLGTVGWTTFEQSFKNAQNLTDFNAGNTDTSAVTSMNYMFEMNTSLVNVDLTTLDTSNVTDMAGLFSDAVLLTSLDLSNFDTSKVTNMAFMFWNCESINFLDISSFDTSEVLSMDVMFYEVKSLTSLDLAHFNTSKVESASLMFGQMQSLSFLDISNFNTSSMTSMSGMFDGVQSLSSLNLDHFDTSNVTSMSRMFAGMESLNSLDISSFDTSKVTNMTSMFSEFKLASLDLSHFDTSQVTEMRMMFIGANNLTSLNISSFDTSNVTTMQWMFLGVSSLSNLDLSHFNTSKVTDMSSMFAWMSNLTTLDISNFDTSQVTTMNSMFRQSSSLASLDLSHFNTSKVSDMSFLFSDMSSLVSLNTTDWDLTLASGSSWVLNATNPALAITCNQGGTPGTGDFFGEPCQ